MSRPLLHITRVDLKGVERELARIATALEIATGLRPAPTLQANPVEPAVSYSSEDDLLREEFSKLRPDIDEEQRP